MLWIIKRAITVTLACVGAGAALGVGPMGEAVAAPCDGAYCVPNVREGSKGAACSPRRYFPFGLDANGNTLICLYGGSWSSAPPLVGVRDEGGPCTSSISSVAQSPEGLPLLCSDYGIWQQHTGGLPY